MRLLNRLKKIQKRLRPDKTTWDIYVDGFNAKGEPIPENAPAWIITTNPEAEENYRKNTKVIRVGVDLRKI